MPGKETPMTDLPTTEPAIRVSGLVKRYGRLAALGGVSFTVERGEIFAYLGPNGAGKTTTINILCGLVCRSAGDVAICGADIDRDPLAVKRRIGIVPEESNLYPELTCRRNLEYLGELYGLPRKKRLERVSCLLDRFGLADRAATPFRSLSRGLKRRLTIAAALVHSPEVLLLDEPTTGLDVPSARSLRDLIRSVNRDGTTVFLTTHNLAEAETLASRVLILVHGRVAAEGTVAEIRARAEKARTLAVAFSGAIAEADLLAACPAVRAAACTQEAWRLDAPDTDAALGQIVAFARQRGVRITEVSTTSATLEEAFLDVLERRAANRGAPQ